MEKIRVKDTNAKKKCNMAGKAIAFSTGIGATTFVLMKIRNRNNKAETPAKVLVNTFLDEAKKGSTPKEILDLLSSDGNIPFITHCLSIRQGYLNGFSEKVTGFTQGAMLTPQDENIPFLCYVFETENACSAKQFTERLKETADYRLSENVEADEIIFSSYRKLVLCAMIPVSMKKE